MNVISYRPYEELEGASGARIRYRSPRFVVSELFPLHGPTVAIAGEEFDLQDISMTGLGVLSANDNSVDVGVAAPVLMRYGTETFFEGRGRIVRSQPTNKGLFLGVQLEGDYLNITALRERHRQRMIAYALGEDRRRALELVPEAFRRACADALHLVRSTKPLLTSNEILDRAEERRLLDMVEAEITPPWMALCNEIDPMILDAYGDDQVYRAMKKYTEDVVTPEFLAGPIWNRAYLKPLGYPGDHRVMEHVYAHMDRGIDAGETLYAKLLHRLGVASLICVETRKNMMREMLTEMLSDQGQTDELNVLSIGCGSSEEVRQTLFNPILRPVHFTLLDQDQRALDMSFERLYPETLSHGGKVSLRCLQTGFQRLVNPQSIQPALPKQDLIYSLGIPDYLKQPRAKRFCRTLYSLLKPGGSLVIANVQDLSDNGRWRAECIADWTLIYRSREQMMDLAEDLGGEAELREDSTRNILMLKVAKPA